MKAILVIDMPNKCRECGFYYKDNRMSCYIDDYIKDCKGVCPLKPLPQKKKTDVLSYSGLPEQYRKEGWNDCIDEIIGGNND